MIITDSKPYGVLRSQLKKDDKIGLVTCNTCARMCETGGEKRMKVLAKRLKEDGFNVVDMDIIPVACNLDQAKKPEYKGNTLIVLACEAGSYTLKRLFPKKRIIDATNTVGLCARDEEGNIFIVKKF